MRAKAIKLGLFLVSLVKQEDFIQDESFFFFFSYHSCFPAAATSVSYLSSQSTSFKVTVCYPFC